MRGYQLEFFTEQGKRHGHKALHEWLLEVARSHGIRGATVFMGTTGFGRSRRYHSAHFLELADQPVVITMAVSEDEANQLFDLISRENVHLFYVKIPIEFGETGAISE